MIIYVIITLAFTAGAVFGIMSTDPKNNIKQLAFSLIFIGISYPLHILFGYYYSMKERVRLDRKAQIENASNIKKNIDNTVMKDLPKQQVSNPLNDKWFILKY